MVIHVNTLFTFDADSNLNTINEPWGQTRPAPRLFVGQTLEGCSIHKFHTSVCASVKEKITEFMKDKPIFENDLPI